MNIKIRIIKTELDEITRYEKETGKKYDVTSEFFSKITDHPCQYAFTMVGIKKIGINPGTKYQTPAGVYFYTLDQKRYDQLIGNYLPFASDKPYVGLAKLNWSAKWLKLIRQDDGSAEDEKKADDYLKKEYNFDMSEVREENIRHMDFSPNARIFVKTYFCSKLRANKVGTKPTWLWTKILRGLGYEGVYDGGNAIIHPSEPAQIVSLSPNAYETIGIYDTAIIRTERRVKIGKAASEDKIKAWKRRKYLEKAVDLPPEKRIFNVQEMYDRPNLYFSDFIQEYKTLSILDGFTIIGNVVAQSDFYDSINFRFPRDMKVKGKLSLTKPYKKEYFTRVYADTLELHRFSGELGEQEDFPRGINFKNLDMTRNYQLMKLPEGLKIEGDLFMTKLNTSELPTDLEVGGVFVYRGQLDKSDFPNPRQLKNFKINRFAGEIDNKEFNLISGEELIDYLSK